MRKRILSVVILGISLLTACNKTDNESVQITGNELAFNVNKISETRGTPLEAFTDGSKVGVYAYRTLSDGSAPTSPNVMNNQELTFNGASWSYSPKQYWSTNSENVYDFYAYAPYTKSTTNGVTPSNNDGELSINYNVPTDCANQPDLMIGKTTVNTKSGAVALSLQHTLSAVAFKVKGNPDKVVANISVSNIFTEGNLTYGSDGIEWETIGSRTTEKFDAKINTSVKPSDKPQNLTTSDGYLMMIPQAIPDGGITVNVTIKGEESDPLVLKITADMVENGRWEANKQYSYVINAEDIVDFDKSFLDNFPNVANCYIINPLTTEDVIIPINEYISYFWTNYGANKTEKGWANLTADQLTANVIWTEQGTVDNVATIIDIDDVTPGSGTMTKDLVNNGTTDFTASTTTMGLKFKVSNTYANNNFTIGVKKVGSANYLWSWHIWVTDYNPYIASGQKEVTYDDVTNTWMDRNLGAYSTEYVPEYGLGTIYYQWGRKDPIPAKTNTVGVGEAPAKIAGAVKVPNKFYTQKSSDGDWCGTDTEWDQDRAHHWRDKKLASIDVTYTYDNRKSIFDPSPLGWMVPEFYDPTNKTHPFDFMSIANSSLKNNGITSSGVFFPASGYFYDGITLYKGGSKGCYWNASPKTKSYSCGFSFTDGSINVLNLYASRSGGNSVRSIKQE